MIKNSVVLFHESFKTDTLKITSKEINLGDQLSTENHKKLLDLLNEFLDIFATSNYELGRTNICIKNIDTGDHTPIHQVPYRVSFKEREIINVQIKEMLDAGIIRRSHSPWASPVVLVKKKTGDWRFCVDYRKLNKIINIDRYPMPIIDDLLAALDGSKFFSTLDCFSGYWQISLAEEDKQKTAFVVPEGLYEFNVLPFGLASSPACFSRCMD